MVFFGGGGGGDEEEEIAKYELYVNSFCKIVYQLHTTQRKSSRRGLL